MKIKEIISVLEDLAPLALQESYDNCGLLVGDPDTEIKGALVTIDVTEQVIDEAIDKNCGLIIAHHPLIFAGIKKLNGKDLVERCVIKCIKNNIAVYAIHTNLDNLLGGVNMMIAEKLGLQNVQLLDKQKGILRKLVTFCPTEHAEKIRQALFDAGAGHIGNYDSCSFNLEGRGSFRAGADANPFAGQKEMLHFENEIRVETVFPSYLEKKILGALFSSHPYEEVAYDVYPLENSFGQAGAGMIGELENETGEEELLNKFKEVFDIPYIRHSPLLGKKIKKIAFCGGSGSFLIKDALRSGAGLFMTGDLKYHQFFDADGKMVIADIGHYESEQFTKELIHRSLKEKFSNFALLISGINTNPVNYL